MSGICTSISTTSSRSRDAQRHRGRAVLGEQHIMTVPGQHLAQQLSFGATSSATSTRSGRIRGGEHRAPPRRRRRRTRREARTRTGCPGRARSPGRSCRPSPRPAICRSPDRGRCRHSAAWSSCRPARRPGTAPPADGGGIPMPVSRTRSAAERLPMPPARAPQRDAAS